MVLGLYDTTIMGYRVKIMPYVIGIFDEENMIEGELNNSITFHTPSNEVRTSIELETGWNWFSLNVFSDDMSLNNVLAGLEDGSGTYIKMQSSFADYYSGYGWYGQLSDINNTEILCKINPHISNSVFFNFFTEICKKANSFS